MFDFKKMQPVNPVAGEFGIGIDFGTSNSSIAIYDGKQVRNVKIKNRELESSYMPTAVYMTRELIPETGFAAIDRYLSDNAGRCIKLGREEVGRFTITVGGTEKAGTVAEQEGITIDVNAHALTDLDVPGRLFRSLKRWLGQPDIERVKVFAKNYRLVALLTPILQTLAAQYDEAPLHAHVHLGRPVAFEGNTPDASGIACQRLEEACGHAGMPPIRFYPEPVAAIVSYLYAKPWEMGKTYLSFDFGGGTLDVCVIRTTEDSFEILSIDGISLGGDAIDKIVFAKKLFPELGQGVKVKSRRNRNGALVEFRFREYADLLLDWQNTYQLNSPVHRDRIMEGMRVGGEAAEKLKRLRALIVSNYSYEIFREIERAKIALSTANDTRIDLPGLDLQLVLTRQEFESFLSEPLQQIRKVVTTSIATAGLAASDIDGVVCTGGSSRIPLMRETLADIMGQPVEEHDTFTSIASGLAIANYHGYSL